MQLTYIFSLILQKDAFYTQPFPDAALAIREHEDIFNNEKAPAVIRKILLEQYSKELKKHQGKVA